MNRNKYISLELVSKKEVDSSFNGREGKGGVSPEYLFST